MKTRKDSTIIALGIIMQLPLVLLLGSTIIPVMLGIIYACALCYFLCSTIIGRKFARALYRATLRTERFLLGDC